MSQPTETKVVNVAAWEGEAAVKIQIVLVKKEKKREEGAVIVDLWVLRLKSCWSVSSSCSN